MVVLGFFAYHFESHKCLQHVIWLNQQSRDMSIVVRLYLNTLTSKERRKDQDFLKLMNI